jgi:hypothetical protein
MLKIYTLSNSMTKWLLILALIFYHIFIESYSKTSVDTLFLILLYNVETLYIVTALQLGFS